MGSVGKSPTPLLDLAHELRATDTGLAEYGIRKRPLQAALAVYELGRAPHDGARAAACATSQFYRPNALCAVPHQQPPTCPACCGRGRLRAPAGHLRPAIRRPRGCPSRCASLSRAGSQGLIHRSNPDLPCTAPCSEGCEPSSAAHSSTEQDR